MIDYLSIKKSMPFNNRPCRVQILLSLIVLILVHFLIQWVIGQSSILAESFYDEAVTGEMALHILKGEHQLFFWGQPYMGSLEAYLTSFLFHLFGPSAMVLHSTDILIFSFMLLLLYNIGTLVGGWSVGILSATYWALSPLYLSIIGQLATGGHEEACAAGTFVLFGIGLLAFKTPKNPIPLAFLIGLMAGLGWWSSLLSAPFVLAGAIGLSTTRPRLLLSKIPWMGLSGFLFGSLPFWVWQFYNSFSTFRFLGSGEGGGLRQFPLRLYGTLRFSLVQSFLGDWWDGHSVLPSVPSLLAWAIFLIIYLPVFIIVLTMGVRWLRRLFSLQRPIQKPIDLINATFLVILLVFSASEQGSHGSLRYSLALYVPLTVLLGYWLRKIFWSHKILGSAVLLTLIGFNLFQHYLFLVEYKKPPYRPVDRLIQSLKDHGIRYAFADNRISQVLTFESREEIICADYFGQRNYNYLQTVNGAPARQVALVTHQRMGNPNPETMAAALQLIGGSFKRVEVGPYVFWYDFKEPSDNLKSLSPQAWRITASQEQGQVALIKDRDLLTSWKIPKKAGDYVSVDLGKPKSIARISILPGPIGYGLPAGFKLETSLDQKKWQLISEVLPNDMLGGLYWYHGRPRLDQNPRLQISFAPHPTRYIRFTNLTTPEEEKAPWTIAELFVYEAVPTPNRPSIIAQDAFRLAVQALDHWMDDPTGPHPLFPNVSLKIRQRQVNWHTAVHCLQKAIHEAPDWEEPHQRFGEAVDLGELWNKGGRSIKNTSVNFDTLFPEQDLIKIAPTHFKVFSNTNNSEAFKAMDRDPSTRWGSSKGQEPGMFFQIELEKIYPVSGFSLFYGSSLNDYPQGLAIQGSPDGLHWQDIPVSSKTICNYSAPKA